jgi:DNA-binding XRE family transcriptional regulator
VNKNEFIQFRNYLGKTQFQVAQLLGTSPRAIQSFEQGWRNISISVERQLLFLVFSRRSLKEKNRVCWEMQGCPLKIRRNCPAWEFKMGRLCWFINGTICYGEVQRNWRDKMKLCRQCEVFTSLLSFTEDDS